MRGNMLNENRNANFTKAQNNMLPIRLIFVMFFVDLIFSFAQKHSSTYALGKHVRSRSTVIKFQSRQVYAQ